MWGSEQPPHVESRASIFGTLCYFRKLCVIFVDVGIRATSRRRTKSLDIWGFVLFSEALCCICFELARCSGNRIENLDLDIRGCVIYSETFCYICLNLRDVRIRATSGRRIKNLDISCFVLISETFCCFRFELAQYGNQSNLRT